MKNQFILLLYFVFTLTVFCKLTYADNNEKQYLIDDIKLGEIDTLKINFFNLSNIDKINWDDLNLFFENKDIEFTQIKEPAFLINEMWYTVQPFDLINQSFDSIPIKVNFTNNRDSILFISLKIDVTQEKDIKNEEFRELKPILTKDLEFRISELWTDPFYRAILIILLLIIILCFLIFKYLIKTKKTIVNKKVINPPINYTYYLEKIKKLKNENYIEKKQYKLFYTYLSEIYRGYLEFRFNISALESTSDDLISELKKIKIMEVWMLNFIQESDLVKFAKYIPNKNEELLFINLVEDFIKKNIKTGKDNINNN